MDDSLTNIVAKEQANDQIGSGGSSARITVSQIYRYGALRIVQARISILSNISDAFNYPLMNILTQDIPYQPVSQRVPGVITILPQNGTERSYTCLGYIKPAASNGAFYLYQSAMSTLSAGTTLDIILIYPTA